jgi:hypothetical protein
MKLGIVGAGAVGTACITSLLARNTASEPGGKRCATTQRRCSSQGGRAADVLEPDDFSSNRHPALSFCLSMIFSENRDPLFRIML